MKNLILTLCLIAGMADTVYSQGTTKVVSYDVWVGQWNLTWDDGNGQVGKGTNNIVKILDGAVIQENFEATEGKFKGFKGTSLTVYHSQRKQWKQAWTDNQGSYFDFVGATKGKA